MDDQNSKSTDLSSRYSTYFKVFGDVYKDSSQQTSQNQKGIPSFLHEHSSKYKSESESEESEPTPELKEDTYFATNDFDDDDDDFIPKHEEIILSSRSDQQGFKYELYERSDYIKKFKYIRDSDALNQKLDDINEGFRYFNKQKFGSVSPIMKRRPKVKTKPQFIPKIPNVFYIPIRTIQNSPRTDYEILNTEPFSIRNTKYKTYQLTVRIFQDPKENYIKFNFVRLGMKWERRDYLIGYTFVPNPKHYKKLVHRDGNTLNDHYENLRWFKRGDESDYSDDSD